MILYNVSGESDYEFKSLIYLTTKLLRAYTLSGPLDKGGASTSVFGQNGNRPAAGIFF